jgi:hypothetical protein
MTERRFDEIIAENFEEICRNFKTGLAKVGYPYDEDLMQDAYVSCHCALKGKLMTKQEAIKYYWTSYINKYKTFIAKQHETLSYDDVDMDLYDIEDKEYNTSIDDAYNVVINELYDMYGVKKTTMWEAYITKNKELKQIYGEDYKKYKFANITKQIKRYINKHVLKSNRELQEILANKKDL